MARIFISYREIDRSQRDGFIGMMKNPNNTFSDIPEYSQEDLRSRGEQAVKNYIKGKMESCDIVICLIGTSSHNSPWINYEVDVAISQQKPIIPVRIPKTSGGLPPRIRHLQIIEWNIQKIQQAIGKI